MINNPLTVRSVKGLLYPHPILTAIMEDGFLYYNEQILFVFSPGFPCFCIIK